MHEMSIATQLLETVLAVARDNHAEAVEAVEVELGALKLVVPEALDLAWQVLTDDTIAAGSRIETTELPVQARCRHCGRAFEAGLDDFRCAACGQADVEITAGDEIILKSVVCRTPAAIADAGET